MCSHCIDHRRTGREEFGRTVSLPALSEVLSDEEIEYSRKSLIRLYRQRWGIETRIGSLKTTLKLNVLRSKTLDNVRSEVAATILAHNLVWTLIHQAVNGTRTPARRVSFAGAVKAILAFSPRLRLATDHERPTVYRNLLAHIRKHTIPHPPNRTEPELVKRDNRRYGYLKTSRAKAREECLS